jgi:hypothetical protein
MDPPEHIASREEKTHRNLVVTDREQSKKRGSRAKNESSSDLLSLQFEGHPEHPISPRNRPFSAPIPDLGKPSKYCPRIVRELSEISRYLALRLKPRPCPESRYSPIIIARQEIFSRKGEGGYCTEHLATQEWRRGRVWSARSPIIRPNLESGNAR